MAGPQVLLVAMPWDALEYPSLQLGILQSVLERAGVPTESRSLKLAFMEHCIAATAGRPEAERVGIADYHAIASEHHGFGLGEWVFAVPPYLDTGPEDQEYWEYVRGKGVPDGVIAKAIAMRALVPAFLERCVEELLALAPGVVGFTSAYSQNVPSLVLAKLLKARDPSLAIVFGGANCEGPMGAALHRAFPWVDVVVRGEAECVLPELVRDLLGGGPIRPHPGICYRPDGEPVAVAPDGAAEIPMDETPTPAFDEYFARLRETSFYPEVLPDVRLTYETARGCWWGEKSHCTFCGLNGLGMAFRSKSPARVLEELLALARKHGRLDFQVVDNILDLRYLREVLPQLRDAGLDLRLFYETKANLRQDQVRLLREAGVDRMQPGIESLSTPILRLMKKGVTAFQNVRLLKWCGEYGVRVFWNVIYGFPGEPPKEYERMADVVPSLAHLDPPMLCGLGLDRFSPYHARPAEFGLEVLGPRPHYRFLYPTDAATLGDLAYAFAYRHADGRDPDSYIGPLRGAIEQWRAARPNGYRSLRYRRGPGFLVIRDRRPNLEAADYTFEEAEAKIYLACDDGATAVEAWRALSEAERTELDVEDVERFLEELAEMRLVYVEDGRYLGLALSDRLPEKAD